MKKMIFLMMAMLTMTVSANAMSYEQARSEALFLTDKMAYELNLTDAQYEAAYEINLDYLMSVTGRSDVFGPYWERRNLDLSYILYSWQWDAFCAASYFFRPLYWEAGYWHFGVYARYPHRDYFYFGRPDFFATYRGGHSWRMNGGRSFYEGRRDHFAPRSGGRQHVGMRDSWDRGDYRNSRGNSSTRITADRNRGMNQGSGVNVRNRSNSNGGYNNRGNGNDGYNNRGNGNGGYNDRSTNGGYSNRGNGNGGYNDRSSSSGIINDRGQGNGSVNGRSSGNFNNNNEGSRS